MGWACAPHHHSPQHCNPAPCSLRSPNSVSHWKLKTSVYNKRSEPAYKALPMVVYPHKDTMLAKQCKYGIVYSQAHRFMRRCTFRSDFDYATAPLLTFLIQSKQYSESLCFRQLRKFCNKYKHKFGLNSGRKSLKAITLAVKQKTSLGVRVYNIVNQHQ